MSHIGTKFILAEKFTFDPLSNTLIDKEDSEEIIRLGSNESRILWLLAQPKRGDFSQ
ncbi:cholera toxin transcriptional activator [Vibrio cholerae]|nr:cholera toxin transcriptional activator [Vibrio cholerae]